MGASLDRNMLSLVQLLLTVIYNSIVPRRFGGILLVLFCDNLSIEVLSQLQCFVNYYKYDYY